MKDQLKRILKLVRRTGDTVVVTDPNGEDVYVVMNLDQYEHLLEMSEATGIEGDFDRCEDEDEGFVWSNPETGSHSEISTDTAPDIWGAMKPAGEDGATWDLNTLSEQELSNLEEQYKEFAAKSVSEAISETIEPISVSGETEQKKVEMPEKEEDFGEEQFYLEPID